MEVQTGLTGHVDGSCRKFASLEPAKQRSCKTTSAPLRARIGPMGALAALSPGSTLPRPHQEPANLRIEPTISHSARNPNLATTSAGCCPGAAMGAAMGAATGAPTGLGPGATQTIGSQVHFRQRRLVPDSLNQQHETPTTEHLGSACRKDPLASASCLSREPRFFGKGIGEGSRARDPVEPVQAAAFLSTAWTSPLGAVTYMNVPSSRECSLSCRKVSLWFPSRVLWSCCVLWLRFSILSVPCQKGPCEGPCSEPTTVPHWRHTPSPSRVARVCLDDWLGVWDSTAGSPHPSPPPCAAHLRRLSPPTPNAQSSHHPGTSSTA